MAKVVKEYINIEDEFFVLDKEKRIAYMKLEFDKPSDIFDQASITKLPILSDDFIDWVNSSFALAPKKYKIDLEVTFNDFEGFNESELNEIFKKNMVLEFKKTEGKAKSKNKIAYSLIIIGIVFFVSMILINKLWSNGGVLKDIFSYIADIATTVTFWEAMTILVVENKERRSYMRNLFNKYGSITFKKKEEKDE